MHHSNPNPPRKPPAREPAADEGRSRGRRPRSGPPGFTIEVQLLAGEAGRRLAQEQAEAIAAVLAWLAGHPPTPPAATGPAATAASSKPVGQSTAMQTGPEVVRAGDAARSASGPDVHRDDVVRRAVGYGVSEG